MDSRKVSNKAALKDIFKSGRVKDAKTSSNQRKKVIKAESRMQIVDDDIGLPSAVDTEQQEAFYADAEEAPAVVGVVDERTGESVRDVSNWRQLGESKKLLSSSKSSSEAPEQLHALRAFNSRKRKSSDSDLSPERPTKSRDGRETSSRFTAFRESEAASSKNKTSASTNNKLRASFDSDVSPERPANGRYSSPQRRSIKREEVVVTKAGAATRLRSSRERGSNDSDLSPERPTRNTKDISHRLEDLKKQVITASIRNSTSENHSSASTPVIRPVKSGLITDVSDFQKSQRRVQAVSRSDAGTKPLAATVFRDRDTGRKTDRDKQFAEEAAEKARQAEERKALIEKYAQLGRGVRQTENQQKSQTEMLHEMSKPLARTRDDKDLDRMRREEQHLEDPMLQFQQPKKQRKSRFDNDDAGDASVFIRPVFKGIWPPNRFNLPPGHRWDGVDRSNGFEKKYFQAQANKRATEETAYKWSTEDM